MVNVLSVYVTDRKIGNTLSVFLVHTGKIIYFLSGTDYFCRYFSNTQENYEKKSTRQNLPQSEHPAPSENPKNPVQRQKEKKKAHSSYVIHSSLHLPCKQEAGAVQPCWWWPVGSLHWFRSTPSRPNSRWIQAAAGCRSGTAITVDCASALLSNHSRSRCSTVDVCACLDFKKFSKKCYSRHHIESCDTYMKH